ncbi:hypothetical protein [Ciceribacter sp. RN22]|uniref:hypothetical protein n=1 Tax=Ciceribacter sp. RN22 TaxID=2954932 RepID=UPI002093AE34|nr:hypothetical protein [Ciceribacter sp. RN22]MCO6177501.1 hypothetical protein [Ciceribacter sp. RN22]
MRTKNRVLLLGSLASVVVYLIWLTFFAFPDVTVRYRIDADFEVDGSPARATAIWEVIYKSHPTMNGSWKGITTDVLADAATAKLPSGHLLLVSVNGPDLNYYRYQIERWNYPNLIPLKLLHLERAGDRETIDALRKAASERRTMPFGLELLPKLWILPDPKDPTTLYEPEVCDQQAQCPVRFIKGTITFVRNRQYTDITSTFPWLAVQQALWTKAQIEKAPAGKRSPATNMFTRRL